MDATGPIKASFTDCLCPSQAELCLRRQRLAGAVFPKRSGVPAWLTLIFKSMFALRSLPAAPHCKPELFPCIRRGLGASSRTKEQSLSISGRTMRPCLPPAEPGLCFASKSPSAERPGRDKAAVMDSSEGGGSLTGAGGPGAGRSRGCPMVQTCGCQRLFQRGESVGTGGQDGLCIFKDYAIVEGYPWGGQPQGVGCTVGVGPQRISYGLGIIGPDVWPRNVQVVLGITVERRWQRFKREK